MKPWEQVVDAILRGLAARELQADQAVPWLKALVDYADAGDGNGLPRHREGVKEWLSNQSGKRRR